MICNVCPSHSSFTYEASNLVESYGFEPPMRQAVFLRILDRLSQVVGLSEPQFWISCILMMLLVYHTSIRSSYRPKKVLMRTVTFGGQKLSTGGTHQTESGQCIQG